MVNDKPSVSSAQMHESFELQARRLGFDPTDKWIGGYVDYEWNHLRHLLMALPVSLAQLPVLEFGCNVGASAIVFAHLGACVCACDIDPGMLELARWNALRHGRDEITFTFVPDSRCLPYADGQFAFIACNSVLEYVSPDHRGAVMAELDRVLAPGGMILLTGTSNRVWPREVHSRRWLTNYVPRAVDRLTGKYLQRGMSPWTARTGFGRCYDNLDSPDQNGFFARSRRAMGVPSSRLTPLLLLSRLLGVTPGLLTPNLSCLLRKRAPAAR